MPLINTSVPNLIQGVSQQPDTLKYDGQCKEQINAYSSVADGLKKRPNANLVKYDATEIGENAFVHTINRSESEKYLMVITPSTLTVHNLLTDSVIKYNDGNTTPIALNPEHSYLATSNPRENLKAITVGDNTWIVNKTVTTQMSREDRNISDDVNENEALVFVKQAGYDKTYEVSVLDGGTNHIATATTISTADDSSGVLIDSAVIAADLAGDFGGSITATVEGSTIKLVKDSTADFNIKTKDGFADKGLGVVYKEVADITDLPVVAPHGFRVKVRGDAELDEDDYYLNFRTNEILNNGEMGRGGWVEDVGFAVPRAFDATTMPYKLESENLNKFFLSHISWDGRIAGDRTSNPDPSFIGSTISNLFFYKNRLGFLSNDKVVMSEAGQYFNLFRTTVTNLLDSDPIDIGVATTNVTNLESAVAFQENLILFSNRGQFVLKGGDLLTPSTVSVNPITNYDQATGINPISLGSYIYFPFTRGNFSGLREFAVSATGDTYTAEEVTNHIPSYIPKNVIDVAGSSTEDVIAVLSSETKDTLYIYKYFWSGNQKILSAWSKFTLQGCEIRGIDFIDSTLYITTDRYFGTNYQVLSGDEYGSGTLVPSSGRDFMILSMTFTSGLPDEENLSDGSNLGFMTHLDFRVAKKIRANQTQLTAVDDATDTHLDYFPLESTDFNGDSFNSTGARLKVIDRATGVSIPFTRSKVTFNGVDYITNSNQLVFESQTTDRDVFVGVEYDMQYTFSEQIFKVASGKGKSATGYTKNKIKNGNVFFDDSAFFQVKVTPERRDTYTNEFTTQVVDDSDVDSINLDSGTFSFPVFTKPENTTITIENGTPYPSTLQGAEFESFVHSRSNRYG
tara:strand:- start:856 stop:3417 length:2562 start_codon:yes stop_codon:yes gene_type:complete